MTTETAALTIPDLTLARWVKPHAVMLTDVEVADHIRAIAAPVVAEEVRRLAHETLDALREEAEEKQQEAAFGTFKDRRNADMWLGRAIAYGRAVDLLRARADELSAPSA